MAKTRQKSANVIDDADLSGLFGIDMDIQPDVSTKKKPASPAGSTKTQKKATVATKKGVSGNLPKGRKKRRFTKTATSRVAVLICASAAGMNIDTLVEKTGYTRTKLYGIVQRLKKQGEIKNRSHGVYEKA